MSARGILVRQGGEDVKEKTPAPQVWPTLRARDARSMIKFLAAAFGFEETVVYGEGDLVAHAQLSWPPGGGIMLGSARETGPDDPWPQRPGSFAAYVVTDEPDALFARATAAGATVLRELHETERFQGFRRPRSGGQPLVVRDLPRRANRGLSPCTLSRRTPSPRTPRVRWPGPRRG